MRLPGHPATWVKATMLAVTVIVGMLVHNPITIKHETIVQKGIAEPPTTTLRPKRVYMPRTVCLGLKRDTRVEPLRDHYHFHENLGFGNVEFKIAEDHNQLCTMNNEGENPKADLVLLAVT